MEQFMDQVKTVIRTLARYRFWIAISVAAIFSMAAYWLGSRPVRELTKKETAKVEQAEKDVKQYSAPGVPNDQFKPIISEKTEVLTKDVNTAWKALYERQLPLLTWPEEVQDDFRKWGRAWPENVDQRTVQLAIIDYSNAYPKYIESLYKICKPFDLVNMKEGIVLAPHAETLLRPTKFDISKPPDLSKVWSTQERHWTQRTLLEVVASVNRKAKNWDEAIIKQIQFMEVGNMLAQDQRSIANEEVLEMAEPITEPGVEAAEAAEEAAPAVGIGRRGDDDMGGMGGMGGMMGATASEDVYYINKGPYKIMPVLLSVLIDQDRIQNLLVELENSPMSIQVMDYEMSRPMTRVIKPDLESGNLGSLMNFGGGMGMAGAMGGQMRGMGGQMAAQMRGMGMGGMGMAGAMAGQMRGGKNQIGFGGMGMGGQMAAQMRGMGMGGQMGGMGMGGQSPQGINLRGAPDRKKTREETQKSMETQKSGPSLFDPYYNIVEVKVYGQARFYNAPPSETPAEASPGEGEAESEAPAKKTETPAEAKAAPVK